MNEEEVNEKMKEMYEMGREMKEKLKKLEQYEAEERRKAKWQPYRELEAHLAYMHACKTRLQDAAYHQDEADEISDEFDLDLQTHGRASIWDAFEDLENQIEAKEKESLEMYHRLEEEE